MKRNFKGIIVVLLLMAFSFFLMWVAYKITILDMQLRVILYVASFLILPIIIIVAPKLSRGNLSDYNLAKFHLVWKDCGDSVPEDISQRIIRRTEILGIASVLLILLVVIILTPPSMLYLNNLFEFAVRSLNPNYVFAIVLIFLVPVFMAAVLFLTTLVGLMTYLYIKSDPASKRIHVFKEGVRCNKNFLEWKDIESIEYLRILENIKKFNAIMTVIFTFNIGAARSNYMFSNSSIKINTKNKRLYSIDVWDKDGFNNALKKLEKEKLLKK